VSFPNRWAHREEQGREMGGRGRLGAAWRKGNDRERDGLRHGGQQRGVKDMAGNGPRSSSAGGGAVVRTGESGGARGTRHCATDRWGRAITGPGGQRRGAGGREKSETARRRGADRRARPAQCRGLV
jgi:hypothetical protein